MKKALLKIGDIVEVRKNGEILKGMVIDLGTYKADIATEQTIETPNDFIKTSALTYNSILGIAK